MNKIKFLSLLLIGLLYVVAVFWSSIYIHESWHKFQYRNIEKINEDLCVSILGNCQGTEGCEGKILFGHYLFNPITQEGLEKAKEISATQEIGACTVQIIWLVIFYTIPMIIILNKKMEKNEQK